MPAPRELDQRGIGPWEKNRRPGNLGGRREIFSGSPLSRIPEPSLPGIMPMERFVKEVVVPFGQRVVAAQDKVVTKVGQLLDAFPDLNSLSLNNPSGFILAAETAGFARAESFIYYTTLRDRYEGMKKGLDDQISRLSRRSLMPGVPVVVLDTFVPKDKHSGIRQVNKRNVVYAAGGTVGGLTAAGLVFAACQALASGEGSPPQPIPPGVGIIPTPEGLQTHPLTIVCPNPNQMGDQKYPLSVVTPKLQGIAEYKSVNAQDAALTTQLNAAINKKFGPNDIVICSPAYGEGVSPVVNQVIFDRPTGEGNWFVFLEDGRLVGPKEDRLFTPDNKWVQANDVAHYSLGRVGEGKFDSMVFTAPRKNATDPEIVVGILDRQTGRVLTGKEMIDKYGGVFSKVPFAILASLDQFRQSIPANLLSQVDHFGYVPTPTPDGKIGLKLAALRSDGTVVFALGQETPKATPTPSPTETPKPTAMPDLSTRSFNEIYGEPIFTWTNPPTTNIDRKMDWNSNGWYSFNNIGGGTITVVPDEVYGQALEYKVTQDLPNVRVQLNKIGPPIKAPFVIRVHVKLGKDFQITNSSGGINLLTVIRDYVDLSTPNLIAGIDFGYRLTGDLKLKYPTLENPDPKGNPGNNYKLIRGRTALSRDNYNIIEFRVDENDMVYYLLNGKEEARGLSYLGEKSKTVPLPPNDSLEQLSWLHGGSIYGSSIAANSSLRVGKIEVFGYKAKK